MKISERILPVMTIIIMALLCSTKEATAQEIFYNPEMPLLQEDLIIEVSTINDKMNDHGGFPISQATGRVYLPPTYYKHDGRSMGIYIVCTIQGHGQYAAFEARCPKCHYKYHQKGKMIFTDTHFASCNKCGTRAEHLTWHGIGQCQQQDDDELLEIYYLDDYLTESFKMNGKWYIRIYNNPITTQKPEGVRKTPSEPFRYPGT